MWTVKGYLCYLRPPELSEREWLLREPHTLGKPGTVGGTGQATRLFVKAVVWRMRPGVPWRALPERVGKGNALARRFCRWAQAGVWHKLFQALLEPEGEGEGVLGDSTTVKAQAAAAGQKKVRLRSRA